MGACARAWVDVRASADGCALWVCVRARARGFACLRACAGMSACECARVCLPVRAHAARFCSRLCACAWATVSHRAAGQRVDGLTRRPKRGLRITAIGTIVTYYRAWPSPESLLLRFAWLVARVAHSVCTSDFCTWMRKRAALSATDVAIGCHDASMPNDSCARPHAGACVLWSVV